MRHVLLAQKVFYIGENQFSFREWSAVMSDYKHGEMDITEQEKTYGGFIKTIVIVTVLSLATLIFLALVNS